ncbi:Uncharacterized protein dnm_055460 [Desulfonema magnum]|uniref:Uncharacterized protein n=1 Tax=Desulfonema magnum TaxID=45655 RepID=A0A975GQ39_9BACT|nr:Uncharacterized protein dnm_055460 [Desulfonema magnum]
MRTSFGGGDNFFEITHCETVIPPNLKLHCSAGKSGISN